LSEATLSDETRRPGETLRASGVSRSFEGVHALRNVTLELHRGEIVGLIGPNGAGKSTLVNVLSGFDRPTAGTIELGDRDVTRWTPHRRGGTGSRGPFSTATRSARSPCGRTSRSQLSASAPVAARRDEERTSYSIA